MNAIGCFLPRPPLSFILKGVFATHRNVSRRLTSVYEKRSESKQMSALRSKCLLEKVMGRAKNLSRPRSTKYIHMLVHWAASCAIGDKACGGVCIWGVYLTARTFALIATKSLLHINLSLNSILYKMREPSHPFFTTQNERRCFRSAPRPGDGRQAPHVHYNMHAHWSGTRSRFLGHCVFRRCSLFWEQPQKMQTSEHLF